MSAWAGAADLVALALTGELVTDHTLAGRTMAYRLPGRGEGLALTFDAALLSTVGLRPEQLPRVALPDAVGGHVRVGDRSGRAGARFWADAADAFVAAGVVPGTPVVVAGHDHAVGSWAAGIRSPGDRADSLGTAEAVLTVLADPPVAGPDPDAVAAAGMSWVRTVSGRHDAVVAGSSSAGAMVGWLLDRPGAPATVAELLADALADLVRDPGPTDVVVLPYLSGRQCPAPDPTARVTVGPPGAAGSQLTRAVLEGVCLQARWMLTAQAELAGGHAGVPATGRPLTVLGGPGVADPAWARIKRAVMAEPLRRVTAREPVATGAALLAATRAGLLGTDVGTVLSADRAMAGAAPCLPTTLEDGPAPDPYGPMYDRFVAAALGPVVGASAAGAESAGGRRATR